MKKLLIIIVCLFFVTGCYNYNELQELGIASSILIDYEGDYKVSVEIIEDEKPVIFEGNGDTLTNALEDALLGSEKVLYYNHLNAIFITENVRINDIMDYFLRNPNMNSTFFFLLTETTDIYKDKEEDMGMKIQQVLTRLNAKNFFETSKIYFSDYQDLVLPILNKELKIVSGMGYHKLERAYTMDINDIYLYRTLDGNSGSFISTTCNDNKLLEIKIDKAKAKYMVSSNIKIELDIEASIDEFTCKYDMTNIDDIKKVEELMNKQLEHDITEFIKRLKESNSDILGINRQIYAKNHTLKKDFTKFDYEVKVKTHINKKGLILK